MRGWVYELSGHKFARYPQTIFVARVIITLNLFEDLCGIG
jgi:hypothetical protein